MSKSVIPFTAKLVKFDTEVPFAEVISRLNSAVNKNGSGNIMARLKSTNTQDELSTVVNDTTGDSDFLCVLYHFQTDFINLWSTQAISWSTISAFY